MNAPTASISSNTSVEAHRSLRAWPTVIILMLVNALAAMDRQLPTILLDPIKNTLEITDVQVVLLTSLAFSVCYSCVTLPMSVLADRSDRGRVIMAAIFVWSAMAVICGYAPNYSSFVVGRMGVGVGEAALVPCAFSLISELFPRERRSIALMVFVLGAGIGNALALVVGGSLPGRIDASTLALLHVSQGWRVPFLLVGATGVLLALLALGLFEPRRAQRRCGVDVVLPFKGEGRGIAPVVHYARSAAFLFIPLVVGLTLLNLIVSGSSVWLPTFFLRTYHWSPEYVGSTFGTAQLVVTIIGIPIGALIANWIRRRQARDAVVLVVMTSALVITATLTIAPLLASGWAALSLLIVGQFFVGCATGVVPTTFLTVTPSALRGRVTGCYFFIVNLIAIGCGPAAYAAVTDHVFHDPTRLNLSISCVSLILGLILLACLMLARRRYERGVALAAEHERLLQPVC